MDIVYRLNSLMLWMFPSPYGVSFILMINMYADIEIAVIKFPSPYGVSFILMYLRLEMYLIFYIVKFPSPYGVSFILMKML